MMIKKVAIKFEEKITSLPRSRRKKLSNYTRRQ